ncbi:MAG TPA: LLM class flavin-dependent oxidoreductase [Candidatus Limnocylindria bacterium]|nr:LLM class flavin-dependent oxidoreductase [Candidatus Limnocylindria bacterium]
MRIGVCVPIGERGLERKPNPFAEMRAIAVATDTQGLDSIWVADHLFIHNERGENRGVWEAVAILGALADATTRVELGPLVFCAPFRNPGLLAWSANTLDEISGGRFVLGLGAGWHQPEFEAFGFEFQKRVSYFQDTLEVVVPLLRDGNVKHEGRFGKGDAELRPPGPRKNGPPILIAGSGPRMLGLTAKYADRWNSVWYGLPTDEFRGERRNLEAALREAGRDPKSIEINAGLQVFSPDTTSENGPDRIVGTADHLLEAFRAWEAEGVDEVMCRLEPPSVDVVNEIAEAARRLRG